MAIDKKTKMTFDEWMKYVAENINKPASFQEKVQSKIEKKDESKNPSNRWKS